MHETQPLIDQLYLVAQQLDQETPSHARFSLLLTDNVVELLCHKAILRMVYNPGPENGRSSINELYVDGSEKALGRDFGDKLKYSRRYEKITEEQRDFGNDVHRLRNTVYHQGLRDEAILWSVAWEYHDLGCNLFRSLIAPNSLVVHSDHEFPEQTRHLTNVKAVFGSSEWFATVATRLCESKPENHDILRAVLASAADRRIDEMSSTIEWVAEQTATDPEAVLRDMLFLDQVDTEKLVRDSHPVDETIVMWS